MKHQKTFSPLLRSCYLTTIHIISYVAVSFAVLLPIAHAQEDEISTVTTAISEIQSTARIAPQRAERKTKLQRKCKQKQSLPRGFVYKTLGSNHFSKNDVRRNTVGLIMSQSVRMAWPSCLNILDIKGNNIAKLGLYETGHGWAARYYAGIKCAGSTPYGGATLASKAQKRTRSVNIYIDFGKACYGPIPANRCIGSKQC